MSVPYRPRIIRICQRRTSRFRLATDQRRMRRPQQRKPVMKIICIEEHTIDLPIVEAARAASLAEAGYMADWGLRVKDRPDSFGDNLPHLQDLSSAVGF